MLVTALGKTIEYDEGVSLLEVSKDFEKEYPHRIILANIDGKLLELSKKIYEDCEINFRDLSSRSGFHTLRRTICFVMFKAIYDLYGEKCERVKIEFSQSNGYYCSLKGEIKPDENFTKAVKARMQEIKEACIPIGKFDYSKDEALKIFSDEGMKGKETLFKFRRSSHVNLYQIDGYKDYFYGYMAPDTGYITEFDLFPYEDGFILLMPAKSNPEVLGEFKETKKLFNTMAETDKWGRNLDIETVGELNEAICKNSFKDVMLVTEALQEGKISDIATDISKRNDVKFVMIAGPSSSGKTTFSYRLSTQLRAKGLNPFTIGLDNYYRDRQFCPRDENGNYDFECLEALDVEGFNNDMKKLLNGETVEIPEFNFKTGKQEYKGHFITLKEGDILVVEGIHGLNEKMSYALPKESKYKIYISALTCLNIDEHNRIPTTDVRLLRRMIRDNRTRGTKANKTIDMWASVRNGEEKYIFPFQESADAMFNSSLIYELSVLKQFAEPLLFDIGKDDTAYHEANRLLKFLDYFVGVTSEDVANNSILREFVGGSVYKV